MKTTRRKFLLGMAGLMLVPTLASAQSYSQDHGWNRRSDSTYSTSGNSAARGYVQITNDWKDTVKVTMWTHDRQRIGDYWEIDPDDSVYLMAGRTRIKARANYKIKVGEDWGWVSLGDVGEFRRGRWYVNVRDIWRATHQRDGDGGRHQSDRTDLPDWAR